MDSKNTGWTQYVAEVGRYAATRHARRFWFRNKLSAEMDWTRLTLGKDAVTSAELCEMGCGSGHEELLEDNPGENFDAVQFVEVTEEDYRPYFHYKRITELEERWARVGIEDQKRISQGEYLPSHDRRFFRGESYPTVTVALNITGKVDSLLIYPDEYCTMFGVMLDGQWVMKQWLEFLTPENKLRPTFITFENGKIERVRIHNFGREMLGLLAQCSAPVTIV